MSDVNMPQITISYKGGKEEKHLISNSKDAVAVAKHLFDKDLIAYREEFIVVYLDQGHKTIGWYKAAVGGISSCIVEPRTILGIALQAPVSSILLFHNHPSGNLKPSQADVAITKKLVSAGEMIEIKVLDHIIISNSGYFSFLDEGML